MSDIKEIKIDDNPADFASGDYLTLAGDDSSNSTVLPIVNRNPLTVEYGDEQFRVVGREFNDLCPIKFIDSGCLTDEERQEKERYLEGTGMPESVLFESANPPTVLQAPALPDGQQWDVECKPPFLLNNLAVRNEDAGPVFDYDRHNQTWAMLKRGPDGTQTLEIQKRFMEVLRDDEEMLVIKLGPHPE